MTANVLWLQTLMSSVGVGADVVGDFSSSCIHSRVASYRVDSAASSLTAHDSLPVWYPRGVPVSTILALGEGESRLRLDYFRRTFGRILPRVFARAENVEFRAPVECRQVYTGAMGSCAVRGISIPVQRQGRGRGFRDADPMPGRPQSHLAERGRKRHRMRCRPNQVAPPVLV